jgi:3-hydroxyisobutyrate dehydrogenase
MKTEHTLTDLAIFGLGVMGGRAAERAVAAGLSVTGYDPSEASRARSSEAGVTVTDSPSEATTSAQVILLFLPLPEDVLKLVNEQLIHASSGTTVVDLSTVDPGTSRTAALALAEKGIIYLDAPVLGRPQGCGTWTLVVGGAEPAISRVSELLLATVAANVVRVGSTGAGSVVKLLNNLMFGAINSVTAEMLAICEANHVDPALFVDTISNSGAATVSKLFLDLAPRMVSGDDDPVFSLKLLAKDVNLALSLAESSGTKAPIAATVAEINSIAMDLGLGHRDTSAVLAAYRDSPRD